MTQWLHRTLARIHELAEKRRIRFTFKATRELAALELGLDPDDAAEVIAHLSAEDSVGRQISEHTGEWMYIFKPMVAEVVVYLRLIVRGDCIVVSFHSDDEDEYEVEETR